MNNNCNVVILAIKKNNDMETGKPEQRSNNERRTRLAEFIVLSIISLLFSFVAICISALSKNLDTGYFEFVLGNPEILFTVATLVISVFCEILYMDEKLGKLTKLILPFLFVLVLWSFGAYTFMNFAQPNTYGDVYRIPIVLVTLFISVALSGLAMVLANASNKKFNR